MIWLRPAWAWLRTHWRPILASLGAAVAGIAGVMLLRRRSVPAAPCTEKALSLAREAGKHDGAAVLLEQQASDIGKQAAELEAEISVDENKQKSPRVPPLQEVDDDAEVARILTRRGW